MHPDEFAASVSVRCALKRGLARQALDHGGRGEADMAAIIDRTKDMAPNRKAMERTAQRLARMPGVVRVAMAVGEPGLVVILRNLRHLVNRAGTVDLFGEIALVYTRLHVLPGRSGTRLRLSRASFCQHAMERLVERSDVALDQSLLLSVDTEAVHLLRQLVLNAVIEDAEDRLIRAVRPGAWAGGIDLTPLEDDWGVEFDDPSQRMPVFSARTFLGADQMRPTIFMKWRDLPGFSMS